MKKQPFDINFLARVHEEQKYTISNLKHNIKEEYYKIMQVEAIKAIRSVAADNLISFSSLKCI